MSTRLTVSNRDCVLLLTLDGEDGFPRLERAILAGLAQQFAELESSDKFTGAVLTGAARSFAAGAEISEVAALSPVVGNEFAQSGQRVFAKIKRARKPVIAAIRGYCMGGGLDLALACRVRIATPDAVFAHPGGALGILTGWGGTQRLPRLIGRARAIEMLTSGGRMEAGEALACGLITAIIPSEQLIEEALRRAGLRSTHE